MSQAECQKDVLCPLPSLIEDRGTCGEEKPVFLGARHFRSDPSFFWRSPLVPEPAKTEGRGEVVEVEDAQATTVFG
jgi:hypothetical protein